MEQNANFLALCCTKSDPKCLSSFLSLSVSLISAGILFFSLYPESAMHLRESEPQPITFPWLGMTWNALLLCSSRSLSAFQVQSDTASVRHDLTSLSLPADFYRCPHLLFISFCLTFELVIYVSLPHQIVTHLWMPLTDAKPDDLIQ